MRTVITAVFLMALYGCNYYKSYPEHNYQTNVPIRNVNPGTAKLFYIDEPLPSQAYIEGGEVAVTAKGSQSSRSMITALQQKAFNLGYDAVINIDKHTISEEESTLADLIYNLTSSDSDEDVSTIVSYTTLFGQGIKYLKNVTYLDEVLKESWAIRHSSEGEELLYTQVYTPNGEMKDVSFYSDEAEKAYDDFINKFDLQRLIHQEAGWDFIKDQLGRVTQRRRMRFDDWALEKVDLIYDRTTRKLSKLKITTQEKRGIFRYYRIKLNYEGPVLSSKEVYEEKELIWIETFEYKDQKLTSSVIRQAGQESEKIVTTYEYFQPHQLDSLLNITGEVAPGD